MSSPPPLSEVDAALRARFGHEPSRACVSFVGVDPIEVLRFEPAPDERVYVSLGMSRHPMTPPDALVRDVGGPRAELLLRLRDPDLLFGDVWRRVAVLAAAPAVEGVVYVDGMTVDLGEPLVAGTRCTGCVVAHSGFDACATSAGPVDVFEMIPATQTELAWSRVRGSAELRFRWNEQGLDLCDLARPSARLD